jgi:hypothetical protein
MARLKPCPFDLRFGMEIRLAEVDGKGGDGALVEEDVVVVVGIVVSVFAGSSPATDEYNSGDDSQYDRPGKGNEKRWDERNRYQAGDHQKVDEVIVCGRRDERQDIFALEDRRRLVMWRLAGDGVVGEFFEGAMLAGIWRGQGNNVHFAAVTVTVARIGPDGERSLDGCRLGRWCRRVRGLRGGNGRDEGEEQCCEKRA